MKKLLLFTSLLPSVLTLLQAQPTITTANLYAIGKVLTMQTADSVGVEK